MGASRFSSNCKNGPRLIFRNWMKSCWTPNEVVPMRKFVEEPEEDEEENGSEESLLNSLPEDLWLECLARVPRSSLKTSMMVCRKWRHTLKSGEFYEVRRKIGMVENLLFVFGGAGTGLASAVYCKSSGGWKAGLLCTIQALQENEWLLDYHNADHCLLNAQPAVVKHRIFVLGAIPSCAAVGERECTIVYDAWTKALTRGAPMIHPRKKFACCVINDKIYVSGGCSREEVSREALMGAEEYDPEVDAWRPLPNMPKKRYGCLGAAVNGIFYVIGGLKFSTMQPGLCMQPYAYVGSMDSYNPKTNSWHKTKSLPMGGCVIACTVVRSSIYMLSSMAVELSFWKYDTESEQFSRIKPPPIPSPLRIDSYLKFSCVTMGTSVYIIQVGGSIDDLLRRSGRHGRGFKEGLVLIYDTISEEWSRGPDLPYVKNGATCAVVLC